MAKVTIAGIELDTEAHRNNSVEAHEGIFAHLSYYDKKDAVKQLQDALSAPKAPVKEGK